jgi:hypothetical protein
MVPGWIRNAAPFVDHTDRNRPAWISTAAKARIATTNP